jgi:hypothetical protein
LGGDVDLNIAAAVAVNNELEGKMKEKNVTHHIFGSIEGLQGAVLVQAGNRTLL